MSISISITVISIVIVIIIIEMWRRITVKTLDRVSTLFAETTSSTTTTTTTTATTQQWKFQISHGCLSSRYITTSHFDKQRTTYFVRVSHHHGWTSCCNIFGFSSDFDHWYYDIWFVNANMLLNPLILGWVRDMTVTDAHTHTHTHTQA